MNRTEMEIYVKDNITITFDPHVPCLQFTAGRLPHTDPRMKQAYRELISISAEYAREYPGLCLIGDATAASQMTYDDVEWSVLNVMPKLVQAGIRKVAFVYGTNAHALARLLEYFKLAALTGLPIQRKIFQNFPDARTWLKELEV